MNPELARAYYLAVNLRPAPKLPDYRLMALLPLINRELLEIGVKTGTAGGSISQEQALELLRDGDTGVKPTEHEFRSLVVRMIRDVLNKLEMDLDKEQQYRSKLYNYYSSDSDSAIPKKRLRFDHVPDEVTRMFTGFTPLDNVLGRKNKKTKEREGFIPGIITFLADPGVGKTYITQAIANTHDGPVLFFDNENGEDLVYDRQVTIPGKRLQDKYYEFGAYDVEEVYHELAANPQPDMLVVFDSLQSVLGNGQGGSDHINYQNAYKYATKLMMEGLCKYVIMSSHLKTNNDGMSVNSAGASAIITKQTSYQVTITKGDSLPEGYTVMGFIVTKSRGGVGKSTTFTFRHEDITIGEILTGGI